MLKLRKKAIKSTDKNTLLKFNSFGINYPDKMNEYIEFVEKLNIIIDNIYALDDLSYYFNFDTVKENIIKNLNLDVVTIGIKLEIIRAFCIDELINKNKLIELFKKDNKCQKV